MRIQITGGAGSVESHLADDLISRGQLVRTLDVLSPLMRSITRSRPPLIVTSDALAHPLPGRPPDLSESRTM